MNKELTANTTLSHYRIISNIGTLRLEKKKPWAIDPAYFTSVGLALYLHDLAVAPDLQHRGIGRRLIKKGMAVARAWPKVL
jgi:ribosomal protein S18 acetylase RimI-like enzyme